MRQESGGWVGVKKSRLEGRGGSQQGGQAPRCGCALVSSGVTWGPRGYHTPRVSVSGLFQDHGYTSLSLSLPQVVCVTPGAGTSTACAGMAPKLTSGPRSPCRACVPPWDSVWAAGPATPWPFASCQPSLPWASPPASPVLPQMPPRKPELKKPWSKRETRMKDMRKLLPKPNLTGSEMGLWQRPLNKVTLPT